MWEERQGVDTRQGTLLVIIYTTQTNIINEVKEK